MILWRIDEAGLWSAKVKATLWGGRNTKSKLRARIFRKYPIHFLLLIVYEGHLQHPKGLFVELLISVMLQWFNLVQPIESFNRTRVVISLHPSGILLLLANLSSVRACTWGRGGDQSNGSELTPVGCGMVDASNTNEDINATRMAHAIPENDLSMHPALSHKLSTKMRNQRHAWNFLQRSRVRRGFQIVRKGRTLTKWWWWPATLISSLLLCLK